MDDRVDVEQPRNDEFAGIRRTALAEERTFLAWQRSSLAAFAVALGTGKIVPSLTRNSHWPYVGLGIGFAALGLLMVGYGMRRQREVTRALAAGTYVATDPRLIAVITGVTVLLGVLLAATLFL